MKLRSKRDDDHHCMSCVRWSDCWLLKVLQTLPDAGSGSLLKKSLTACFYVFYISKCNPWSDQVELLLSYVWKSASKIHIYCRLIQLCREWYFHCEFQFCGLENKDVGLWRVAGVVKYSRCYNHCWGVSSVLCALFFSAASYAIAPLTPYRLIGPNSIWNGR